MAPSDLVTGAWALSLVLALVGILGLRQERPLSWLTPLLGVAITAATTAVYLVATGAPFNPLAAAALLGLGAILGLVQGRSTRLTYRGATPVAKPSVGYLVVWAAAYLLTIGLARLDNATIHAIGILAMVFGVGLAVGTNLILLTKLRPTPAHAPVPPPTRSTSSRCARCGTALEPDDAFCGECGAPRPQAKATPSSPTAPPPLARPARAGLLLATVALVALLGGGWLLASSDFMGILPGRDTTAAKPAASAVPDQAPSPAIVPVAQNPTTLPNTPAPTISPPLPTLVPLAASPTLIPPPTSVPMLVAAVASSPTPEAINRAQEQAVAATLRQLPQAAAAVYQSLDGPERAELDPAVPVPAASTIKLPIMIEVFRQAEAGQLSLSRTHTVTREQVVGGTGVLQNQVGRTLTTLELLETAIVYSDNVGGNMLTSLLGMENVNATMRELGFPSTRMARRFMDLEASRRGIENMTSAGDMAEMLVRIHRGQLISTSASAEMMRILRLRGQRTEPGLDYMGRYLQPRPTLPHVNGTLTGIRNDAGIVERDGRAFILTIFLRGQANEAAAEEAIGRTTAGIQSIVSTPAR